MANAPLPTTADSAAIHVAPAITESSGISKAVLQLCNALHGAGERVELATVDGGAQALPAFAHAFPRGAGPRRLGRSPALRRWLAAQLRSGRADVVHVHGLWRMSTVQPAAIARGAGALLIAAPHGSLAPWAMRFRAVPKRLFWPTLQRPALQRVSCWHAASEAEHDDIRRLGFRQPVAIASYGVRLPPLWRKAQHGERTLLFLGRVHPKKGIDTLIDAWSLVQRRHPRWRVVIAGSDSDSPGHLDAMRRRAAACGADRVNFMGEVTGRAGTTRTPRPTCTCCRRARRTSASPWPRRWRRARR